MIRRPPRSTLFPLHDALPIFPVHRPECAAVSNRWQPGRPRANAAPDVRFLIPPGGTATFLGVRPLRRSAGRTARALEIAAVRSEEHTSELQSRLHLVCRLLLE